MQDSHSLFSVPYFYALLDFVFRLMPGDQVLRDRNSRGSYFSDPHEHLNFIVRISTRIHSGHFAHIAITKKRLSISSWVMRPSISKVVWAKKISAICLSSCFSFFARPLLRVYFLYSITISYYTNYTMSLEVS